MPKCYASLLPAKTRRLAIVSPLKGSRPPSPSGAQDFRRGKSDAAHRGNLNVFSEDISSLRAESPKGIASLSSTAAGLLQSFITSFAGSVSHKSLPSARYRLAPMSLILPASSSPDLKVFLLLKKSFKSSAGGQGETVGFIPFRCRYTP